MKPEKKKQVEIKISKINEFKNTDLSDLCDATESAIIDDTNSFCMGFYRSDPLVRERLEKYWKGVLLVPERQLIVGRIDGVIVASIQLIMPGPNDQTSSFKGNVEQHFVAPWARGFGLAKQLLGAAEEEAAENGLSVLTLDVRSDLESAIKLYGSAGYKRWGTLEQYEKIDGKMYSGHFYFKNL